MIEPELPAFGGQHPCVDAKQCAANALGMSDAEIVRSLSLMLPSEARLVVAEMRKLGIDVRVPDRGSK